MRSRKSKTPVIIEDVEIIDAGAEGKAIAKVDNKVLFIPFVVPGDVVDVRVGKSKKNFMEGKAVAFKKLSDKRTEPKCSHFGVCGGCKWQSMQYEYQLEYKQKQVVDNLERIGKVDTKGLQPIFGSEEIFFYRNKLEFTFSNRRWRTDEEVKNPTEGATQNALGFHIPLLFDKVLDISHCYLQAEPSNKIRNAIREYALRNGLSFYDIRNHEGYLRNLIIRNSTSGDWMLILSVAEDDNAKLFPLLDFVKESFPEITSLQYVINQKMNDTIQDLEIQTYSGNAYMTEVMPSFKKGFADLKFKIGPKSFYQTNSRQAYHLYSLAAEFAGFEGDEVVYDLYTGIGTIANFVAPHVKKVVGVEYVEDSIAEAKINSELNGIENTSFYAGDMAKVFTKEFVEQNGVPDIIITDPPRSGMHEKVIEQLLEVAPKKIVYISCNPATQARDVDLLAEKYTVGRIQPVDMFPHTHHVENIVELIRK
ncbi:23S rRNA (uracil(1939)-C(5))-methyltransferase RlmD [Bacteroidales bacterium OttesenSCG-928-C19]|nr:23S rRNA (uracil(1939)-C(5))-methyltransferase RlmD [Bacteroidales bacterium OttesenSCG-928-C19]